MLTYAVALQVRLPATLRSAGSTAFFFWGEGQVKSFKDVKHVEVKHVEGRKSRWARRSKPVQLSQLQSTLVSG